ncbi:unnamed protein product [Ilex paraguariensis]|uniref:Choline transporter-like protein n=1 Tax=Ilex paraguariensis TaxID=185542 RepID=A0ABC8TAY7_9AQUA
MQIQEPNSTQFETRTTGTFFRNLFRNAFYLHSLLMAILVIFLTIRGLLSAAHSHHFHPKKWYPPLLASTACAGIVSFAWQSVTCCNPPRAIKAAFWLSPVLTCAVGILFVLIGSAGSLVAGAVALLSSVIQSLYSCWVNPRFEYAVRLLSVSLSPSPPKTTILLSIVSCTLYSGFLVSGIGGATAIGTGLDTLFVFVILLSQAWTLHVIKNTLQVAISRVKYMQFASGTEIGTKIAFKDTINHSMGSVCIGSVLVPVVGVVRGSARAISLISGDADEFMFSCTNCYSGVASRLIAYANRWGFVHVGIYSKGFVQASIDTWEMFKKVGLEPLIDSDLTSSFCFLCGVAGGAVSTLIAGSWALVVHKSYATEVLVYAFLIGYFTSRVAMVWPQASISSYYVAYAENPQSQLFDSTIPVRIQELQRYQA